MIDDNRRKTSRFRIEQAKECLETAIAALDFSINTAANRSYYSIFHSMRAVLALEGFDSKKHSGVISYFRRNYIKTKKFDPFFSDAIGNAFSIRSNSDYMDFYILQKSDVMEQIENAKLFLEATEKYIAQLPMKEIGEMEDMGEQED